MKRIYVHPLLFLFVFCASCGGQNKPGRSKENIKPETINTVNSPGSNDPAIYTQYAYADSIGRRLILQNSFPKGGIKYTDSNGEVYIYVVFWTRIMNETDNLLELKIDFPVDSYELASLPGKYFKILVPPDTMTLDKERLFNHGMTDIESFLDRNIHKSSSLKRTINPKESSGFYVILLSSVKGANGVMRTGLSLKGQNLFYRIKVDGSRSNSKSGDKEIHCGSINLKNFMLRK